MTMHPLHDEEIALITAYRTMTTRQRNMLLAGALAVTTKVEPKIRLAVDNDRKTGTAGK